MTTDPFDHLRCLVKANFYIANGVQVVLNRYEMSCMRAKGHDKDHVFVAEDGLTVCVELT